MFGLQKYMDKLNDIEWYFPDDWLQSLEEIMYVEFEKCNDHYRLIKIKYTYVDLLLGLEEMDFNIKKINDKISLTILDF
jgi:hypothetical protein